MPSQWDRQVTLGGIEHAGRSPVPLGARRPAAAPPPQDSRRAIVPLSLDPQEALIEAQVLTSIDSEHFVRLYRFLEGEQTTVAVLEQVRGVDLRSLLTWLRARREGLKPAVAVALLYQACRGLQDVHEGSELPQHPGLRLSNLRLSRSGTLKWTGLEWRARAPAETLLAVPERLPPELAAGLPFPLELESDLYGLSVVLFELLTGEALHDFPIGTTLEAQMRLVGETPVQAKLQSTTHLPAEVLALLEQALNWDPRNRFTSPRELADGLARLWARLEPVPPLDIFADRLYRVIRQGEDPRLLEPWLAGPQMAPQVGLEPDSTAD